MTIAFVNGRVMMPAGPRENVCVVVQGREIVAVTDAPPEGGQVVDLDGATLLPGFIDVQVNGGGAVLFNDAPTVEGIAAIGAAHRRHGTTGFLPTLISDDLATVAKAIAAVDQAIRSGVPGVLGIHVEGPFLAPPRRGIHRSDKLRALSDEAVALLTSLEHGRTLVTLAPEAATPAQITRLAEAGAIVALGHSEADYDTACASFAVGARGVTHLFNAMGPLHHRAPGLAGAALDDPTVYAGVIADGHHLHPAALRLAIRAKGPERIMLVTDAMPAAPFDLQGTPIRREGDRLVDGGGTLAGSTLTMARAVGNVIEQAGVSEADASRMASATPAEFLGLGDRLGKIAPGMQADLVVMDEAGRVTATWIAGEEERYR